MANLLETAQQISSASDSWVSQQIESFNGNQVNVRFMQDCTAKWHSHPNTDEMFVVLSGAIVIETEEEGFPLQINDCFVIKAGVKHRSRVKGTATLMTLICKD